MKPMEIVNYSVLEKVNCPLRGICPRENIVCSPKQKTPFFPKELEVAKFFAQG